jgi:hypothetical protein
MRTDAELRVLLDRMFSAHHALMDFLLSAGAGITKLHVFHSVRLFLTTPGSVDTPMEFRAVPAGINPFGERS